MYKNATAGISTLILFNSFQWLKEISILVIVYQQMCLKMILKIFFKEADALEGWKVFSGWQGTWLNRCVYKWVMFYSENCKIKRSFSLSNGKSWVLMKWIIQNIIYSFCICLWDIKAIEKKHKLGWHTQAHAYKCVYKYTQISSLPHCNSFLRLANDILWKQCKTPLPDVS